MIRNTPLLIRSNSDINKYQLVAGREVVSTIVSPKPLSNAEALRALLGIPEQRS